MGKSSVIYETSLGYLGGGQPGPASMTRILVGKPVLPEDARAVKR